jgi:hypothetical protein
MWLAHSMGAVGNCHPRLDDSLWIITSETRYASRVVALPAASDDRMILCIELAHA